MLANFLIGLREGLEAALIVGILLGYLVRTKREGLVSRVWLGVGLAVALSLGFGAILEFGASELAEQAEETLAGALSFAAAALVTVMIFWMARNARNMRSNLQGAIDDVSGYAWGLVGLAFLAVAREGLETALLLWSSMRATGGGAGPLIGALLGLATAVALGALIYRGALRMNLSKFFTWTGAALIVIAAGVLAYGVHEWQEAGILPGEDTLAYDVTGLIPADSAVATLLKGALSIGTTMSVLQAIVWVAYVVIVGTAFWRVQRQPHRAPGAATSTTAIAAPGSASQAAAPVSPRQQ
jgi:high-affinity iron transporter